MSLIIIVDQNIPPQICDHLRSKRPAWKVWHVQDAGLRGASDWAIFTWAQEHQAIVIPYDEDFADARMYPVGSHCGLFA